MWARLAGDQLSEWTLLTLAWGVHHANTTGAAALYTADQLLNYSAVDLTTAGVDDSMRERDEFNFSLNLPLADAPLDHIRGQLVALAREQHARKERPST